jgi:class 3 adenylate cyclase
MNEEKKSKLSAIMFTDIAGYSAMMEQNEQQAIDNLEKHNELLFPLIDAFDGTIIDTIAEGLLVVFDSAFAACSCGLNIQKAIDDHNYTADENEKFLIRIGIHQGDIWYDDRRVYGNGVNIAARLLPLASPGGICVSDDVYRQFRNKTEVKFHSLGQKKLKEIEQPVEVYELITGTERRDLKDTRSFDEFEDVGDLVKSKIAEGRMKAREALGGKSDPGTEQPESKIETRILGFVEKVMDKALDKWESIPDEKRQDIVREIKKETWYSEGHHHHGPRHGSRRGPSHGDQQQDGNKKKDELEDYKELIPVGAVATVGFGGAMIFFGPAVWLLILMIMIGFIPLGIGISHLLSFRRKKAEMKEQLPYRREGEAIAVAQRHGGRLSVMQLSAEAHITLEEAQTVLDDMTKKGYIGQEIEDSGMITYVFPELLNDE